MTLKMGLIGLGHHGMNAVAPTFYLDGCPVELVAVCDVRADALDAYPHAVAQRFTDYRKMLAQGGVESVYVAAGMDLHHGIVMDCLAAGMHVVVEKPMAATLPQCREMIDEAARRNLVLAVNFESRYSEQNTILLRWLRSGCLGCVEALHFANMWDCHKTFTKSAARRARLVGLAGALDCGIHKLDQARFLVGGNWSRIESMGAWLGEDFTPPPHVGILGQLDNGVMVTLNASLSWATNIKPRPMVNTLEIAGTAGVVLCRSSRDFRQMKLELFSDTVCEELDIDCVGHTSDILLLLKDFVRVVAGDTDDTIRMPRGEDGYQAQYATEQTNTKAAAARVPMYGAAGSHSNQGPG
jgi:predicted dehydrogenase